MMAQRRRLFARYALWFGIACALQLAKAHVAKGLCSGQRNRLNGIAAASAHKRQAHEDQHTEKREEDQ